jgi:uncharacterized protein YjbI with pentapeptide repeats
VINAVTSALASGEDVKIRNFGRLKLVASKPVTNRLAEESGPHQTFRRVRFKPSRKLRTILQEVGGESTAGLDALTDQLQHSVRLAEQIQGIAEAHCRWLDSRSIDSEPADLSGCDFNGVDLFGAILKCANLSRANLTKVDLSDSDLENANLEKADLTGASLAWANLRYANLRGACLRETDLRLADLTGANLTHANLSGANLSGAVLTETILEKAEFNGARLKNTILEKKVRSSRYDQSWVIQKFQALNLLRSSRQGGNRVA